MRTTRATGGELVMPQFRLIILFRVFYAVSAFLSPDRGEPLYHFRSRDGDRLSDIARFVHVALRSKIPEPFSGRLFEKHPNRGR